MISTPKKEKRRDKQHQTLIRDKFATFVHEQEKVNTMDLSLEYRQHSNSPGIEMGIGKDCNKANDGKVKGKMKRTPCNCPNCVNRVSKK
jgi:hypothetical protein